MKKVVGTIRSGRQMKVDTSKKACLALGFKAGTRIIDPNENHGIVVGVAIMGGDKFCHRYDSRKSDCKKCATLPILWYQIDGEEYISFYDHGDMSNTLRPE